MLHLTYQRACGTAAFLGHPRHIWGESAAADVVWAQVCGIDPRIKPWETPFVVLQAYIDDSSTKEGIFVLGGYVATAEAWASFSSEWSELLPLARTSNRGVPRFKMNEMSQQIEKVQAFYKVIEKHVSLAVSCVIHQIDLEIAKHRIWSDNIHLVWGWPTDVFWTTFAALMGNFHEQRITCLQKILPLDETVDFYFDKHSGNAEIVDQWESFNTNDEVKDLYGNVPRFEDDERFLPLQAADFWAWWVRKGYEDGKLEQYEKGDFGVWKATKLCPCLRISVSEDQLVDALIKKIRSTAAPWANIYDAKLKQPNEHALPSINKDRRSMTKMIEKLFRWKM